MKYNRSMESGKSFRSHKNRRTALLVFCAIRFLFAINCHAQDDPSGSQYVRQANKDSVIVFVHGVLGDLRSTWTNGNTKAYWPVLMKDDPYFNDFDIFVIGYPSSVFRSSYTVDELVEVMRRDIDNAGIFSQHKRVYFLCHSMGGLVVRGYLTRYQSKASQVPMIYFFSTPTTGADIARLSSLLSSNRQMRGSLPIDTNEYLASVQKSWLAAPSLISIASYCAYETLDTYGIRVVGESSATNLCNRPLDPIDANHQDIVKPRNIKDAPYIAFRNALQGVRPEPTRKQPHSSVKSGVTAIPFAISVSGTMFSPDRGRACGIYVSYQGFRTMVSPVNAAVFVSVQNLQPIATTLTSYVVDMKTANGEWERLRPIDTMSTRVYFLPSGDLSRAVEIVNRQDFFDIAVAGKSLKQGDVVSGWMFFEYPKAVNADFKPEFKIGVTNLGGVTFQSGEEINKRYDPNKGPGAIVQQFQLGNTEDISGFRRKYYSDPP